MKIRKDSIKRLKLIRVFTFLLFIILIMRLGYWQIVKGESLKKGALSQWTRGVTIKPERGTIYDMNGKRLAISQNSSTIWLNTNDINEKTKNDTIKALSEALDVKENDVKNAFKGTGFQKLKQWASEEETEKVKDLLKDKELSIKGIEIVDDYRRFYPYKNFAAHLLGFTDIDGNGQYGLEGAYDSLLYGDSGKWVKKTDPEGRLLPFESDEVHEATDGLSIVLTIDETIQLKAEEVVGKAMLDHDAENISVIVMEPDTGEVLAMVNKPDFDPNNPKVSLDEDIQEEWEKMEEEGRYNDLEKEWYETWKNYGINQILEPGSTFKLITAAAALEENIVTPETPFYCSGVITSIPGVTLKCSGNHGAVTFREGMNVSCNTVSVETARMLGKEKFLKYIHSFGFGETTGLGLSGEEIGIVPDGENVREAELATMSYGYGVSVTPMQMVNSVSTIANGGNLMKPTIIKALIDSDNNMIEEHKPFERRQVISKKTSNTLLNLMETVVTDGSGSEAYVEGYSIGGKTGTAIKPTDGKYISGTYIASFVAALPIKDPKIAIAVFVDEPKGVYYGGYVAAPIAREIIESMLTYLDIDPIDPSYKVKHEVETVELPNLVGMNLEEAGEKLLDLKLRHMTDELVGDGNFVVVNQTPKSGVMVEEGTVIDLRVEKLKKVTVPDLRGMDRTDAENIINSLGIKAKFEGEGKVTSQSHEPGVKIDQTESLMIQLGS